MKQHHTTADYVGDGLAFLNGIPARALTADEYDRLSDEQRGVLAASPLYTLHPEAGVKPAGKLPAVAKADPEPVAVAASEKA